MGLPSHAGPSQLLVDLVFGEKSRLLQSGTGGRGGGWSYQSEVWPRGSSRVIP